jgi:ribose transport system substrate-binding protein
MKRTRGAAVFAMLAAALAGCSSSHSSGGPTTSSSGTMSSTETVSDADVSVAMVTAVSGDAFFFTQKCGAQAAAAKYRVNFTYQGPTSADYAAEVSVFNAVLTKKPDAVILVPFNGTAFLQPVKTAMTNGMVVVLNNAGLTQDVGTRLYVTDEVGLGKLAGEGLGKQMGGTGTVAIIAGDPTLITAQQRVQGFKEGIAEFPNIKVVATAYSKSDSAKAASDTASIIQAHPDLAGIFATDIADAQGAASAIQAAGLKGKVKLVAYDASPDEVAGLKSGLYQGLVAQDPYNYGYQTVKFAAEAVRKQINPSTLPYKVTMSGKFIDAGNVDSPEVKPFLYRSTC